MYILLLHRQTKTLKCRVIALTFLRLSGSATMTSISAAVLSSGSLIKIFTSPAMRPPPRQPGESGRDLSRRMNVYLSRSARHVSCMAYSSSRLRACKHVCAGGCGSDRAAHVPQGLGLCGLLQEGISHPCVVLHDMLSPVGHERHRAALDHRVPILLHLHLSLSDDSQICAEA